MYASKYRMAIYFCFSDECGYHKPHMSPKEIGRQPYYVRSVLIIRAEDWKKLSSEFKQLKASYGIPIEMEFKWSYLWSIRNPKIVGKDETLRFFQNIGHNKLLHFVQDAIGLLNSLEYAKVLITFTDNSLDNHTENDILKFHFQDILRRIEMEVQKEDDNLAILFVDPVSNEKNDLFRNLYHELTNGEDFIKNYSHVKDSLNIEYSHHSVGIQLADYISGVFNSVLKCSDIERYKGSLDIFFNVVSPLLRHSGNRVYGYGLLEIPRNDVFRGRIRDRVKSLYAELKKVE